MNSVPTGHAAALREMEGKIGELPLLPQVLVKLLQLDRSDDAYFDRLEQLVKEDPTFAVRVIALANSSASSPASPITTIRDALTRMGAAMISGLVASLAVQKVFVPTEPEQVRLWQHAVFAALAAERIAKLAVDLRIDPSAAYLAGLLHDIGRFVMMEHAAPQLKLVDESRWHSPEQLVAADVEIYKYTHSELGFLACQHWGLPDEVSTVVRSHHDVIDRPVQPGSPGALTHCVQIADQLCMHALEREHDAADCNWEAIIERDCCLEVCGTQWVSAADLGNTAPSLREEGRALLAGLGLS